jgi:hypothetical protein
MPEAEQLRSELAAIYISGHIKELPWAKDRGGIHDAPKTYQHQGMFAQTDRVIGYGLCPSASGRHELRMFRFVYFTFFHA